MVGYQTNSNKRDRQPFTEKSFSLRGYHVFGYIVCFPSAERGKRGSEGERWPAGADMAFHVCVFGHRRVRGLSVSQTPQCRRCVSQRTQVFEPQRGDLTKPRATPWVNGTQTDARALKGRNNPLNPTRTARHRQFRARARGGGFVVARCTKAIAAWGKTYPALSGLAAKSGGNPNPGLQPGLRYFAPLGLRHKNGANRPLSQAIGLGQRDPNRYPSPERVEQPFSIPNVRIVVGDSVRVQRLRHGGNTYPALSGLGLRIGG